MPGMSLPTPPFCQLLPSSAPLPLPATRLVSAHFDTAQLRPEDFPDSGITPVRGVAKRQAEYLAGRLCAREALHQLCGQALVPGRDEDGVPLWPAGTVGSITHGAGRAAAMVALARDWRGLGIDLEKHLSAERAARLAGEILTPAELQRAAGLDPEAFARRVTLTFSLKDRLLALGLATGGLGIGRRGADGVGAMLRTRHRGSGVALRRAGPAAGGGGAAVVLLGSDGERRGQWLQSQQAAGHQQREFFTEQGEFYCHLVFPGFLRAFDPRGPHASRWAEKDAG